MADEVPPPSSIPPAFAGAQVDAGHRLLHPVGRVLHADGHLPAGLSTTADPVWVNCVQASVSTVVFGVYLSSASSRSIGLASRRVALGLMALGIITQLGGSSYQWSLGVIGLAIGNPLQMGVMLAAAALLGWIVLGERVVWRAITAIALDHRVGLPAQCRR